MAQENNISSSTWWTSFDWCYLECTFSGRMTYVIFFAVIADRMYISKVRVTSIQLQHHLIDRCWMATFNGAPDFNMCYTYIRILCAWCYSLCVYVMCHSDTTNENASKVTQDASHHITHKHTHSLTLSIYFVILHISFGCS